MRDCVEIKSIWFCLEKQNQSTMILIDASQKSKKNKQNKKKCIEKDNWKQTSHTQYSSSKSIKIFIVILQLQIIPTNIQILSKYYHNQINNKITIMIIINL